MNSIWPLRQGWLLPNKKTNENGHFAPPSGIQMIFSVDLDIKFLMKKSAPPSGMILPWRRGEIPDGGVALTQREELKFHRVINNDCWLYTNVIHIDTTPMTSDGIMTLCKHRLMQVAFYFAGEITQVLDAIPWVRCASGNVFWQRPLYKHKIWSAIE